MVVSLKSLCKRFSSGDRIEAYKIKKFGKYPVFGGNGIRGYTDIYNFDGRCAVIGRQGANCGNVKYFCGKAFMTEHAIVVEANEYNDIGYLSYRMSLMDLGKFQSQSAQPGLSVKTISEIPIEVPNLNIQKKIWKILNNISEKTNNNNHINNNLEELMRIIYQRWFIEFEFPDEEGKTYKSNGGKLVYNDILKKQIPEKWSVKKIGELTEVITGKEDANFSTQNGKYKFFTCSNEILQCDVSAFEGSSILIAGNGDFNVKHYTGRFNAYQRTYVLIPRDISLYCIMYISALYKINSFKRGSNGSIVKFITKNDVENIDVLIPNQKELLKELNKIIFKIEKNNMENDKLKELKEFILPLLMNGQINVDDIEI